jgi:hypothetical protein
MKTICLHHNDPDGRASGAIVRRALLQNVALVEMNYGDPVPWKDVEAASKIVIVDFSLPLEDMKRVADGRDLVWIDHHKTAIEKMAGVADKWLGMRELEEAACVLTWRYYFPEIPVPKAVIFIGDRDIWRWEEEQTGAFSEGLYNRDNRAANDELWKPLLDDDTDLVSQIIEEGSILYAARLKNIQRKIARFGHETNFEGYKTLVVNARGTGEMGDHINKQGYEIGYCYIDNIQEEKLTTFVTLYSKVVDVSQIASKFGGGGHPGAAGFSFVRGSLPFPENSNTLDVN